MTIIRKNKQETKGENQLRQVASGKCGQQKQLPVVLLSLQHFKECKAKT